MPHPTLLGGTPNVQAAGMLVVRNGLIQEINNLSGHFKILGDKCVNVLRNALARLKGRGVASPDAQVNLHECK